MKKQLQDFSAEFVRRVVHFLWRQWGQVGLASASVEPRDRWIVDPEALLLLGSTFARHDPRLFDETMDWLLRNAAFVNLSRLKSLQRRFDFSGMPVMAALATRVMQENRRLNWRLVLPRSGSGHEPLFMDVYGVPLPDFGSSDPGFLDAGFKRGKVNLRGMSRRFNPIMPECALLRLRALFGVSARADVLLYLLTHDAAHPSGIARETGFSQKNIQDTLVDMAASGFVHVVQFEGRMKHYSVEKRERAGLLYHPDKPGLVPRWVTWPPLFRAMEILLSGIRRIESVSMSDELLASELRKLMEEIRPLAHAGGIGGLSDGAGFPGAGYTSVFLGEADRWLAVVLGEASAAS